MVAFLLGVVVGMVTLFIGLHYFGKHLIKKKDRKMRSFIQSHLKDKPNNHAIA